MRSETARLPSDGTAGTILAACQSAKPPYVRRHDCRLCHSAEVVPAIELAPIPITTPNLGFDAIGAQRHDVGQALVSLDLYRCRSCGHLQLLHIIDPELQYNHFRYKTSISPGLPAHYRRMAAEVMETLKLDPGMKVVEIGSNDGTLLRLFKDAGMQVLGIDPARAIAEQATADGLETLPIFFSAGAAQNIAAEHGTFDLVIANNTLANIDDLDDCLAGIRCLLADDGAFVFETSYGADVVEGLLLDTIYHEHLSYFLVGPLPALFARHGMVLYDVQHIPTKGGSLRGFAQRTGGPRPTTHAIEQFIAREAGLGLDCDAAYGRFSTRLQEISAELSEVLAPRDKRAPSIAGYGASVGSMTLIHQFGLADRLAFIVDDKPLGTNLSGPGYEIPIVSAEALYRQAPDLVLLLAWRYGETIIAKHGAFQARGGKFITPLPELRVS